jgi:hypothetical protein
VIRDALGVARFSLHGPMLRPWTFWIRPPDPADRESGADPVAWHGDGKIAKKWSGLLKESFTDADQFGVEFPEGLDVPSKALLLGAVFLVDFVHFENKGG